MCTLLVSVCTLGLSPARAQVRVDASTEVASIDFDLENGRIVSESDLRAAIVLRARGRTDRIIDALAWLPFVSPAEPRLFSPIELQRDLSRIRRRYADAGHPRATARYKVEKDERRNTVAIRFIVDPGPPLLVADVAIAAPDSLPPLDIPAGAKSDWESLVRSCERLEGHPAEGAEIARIEREAATWWRDRGHPWALSAAVVEVDSSRSEARVTLRVNPGPEARIGAVTVEGAQAVRPSAVTRELPFRPGDRFSERALREGQREAQTLDIVRVAMVDVPEQPHDSTVDIRVRITESDPRLISGDLGYVSDAGVTTEARWTHRNIDGRGASLIVSGVAQTGWLALVDDPEVRYRGSVTLGRPFLADRRMSLLLTPFAEYRNDQQDRSTQYGIDLTLLYQFAPLHSIALKYGISERLVYEYRFGDFTSGDIDLLTFLQQQAQAALDSLGTGLDQSSFTLNATTGTLDNPALPRRGIVFRPSAQVTVPSGFNSTEFARLDGSLWGYVPLAQRVTFAARIGGGRLFPFGKSLPAPGENPAVKFLQIKDAAFTAGGTNDVRGWENRLLGPKFPDARVTIAEAETTFVAEGYVPSGGLARMSGSLELQLPLTLFGSKWGSHVFLDGGRVWTPDARFEHGFDTEEQERLFFSTGAGIDLRTPVGPIRFSVGYKLNPSLEDLVESQDLIEALAAGGDPHGLPKHHSRRFAYHLSIGGGW
jgi:outer membrane protein assembly factor BamA